MMLMNRELSDSHDNKSSTRIWPAAGGRIYKNATTTRFRAVRWMAAFRMNAPLGYENRGDVVDVGLL